MDFRDNCGIVYDPRIIETVKNVQVQFYPDFLRNTSFLLILDIKDMQKRYIPEKARFYRVFSRLRGVIFLSRNMDVKRIFPRLIRTELLYNKKRKNKVGRQQKMLSVFFEPIV